MEQLQSLLPANDVTEWKENLNMHTKIGYGDGLPAQVVVHPHKHPFWEIVLVCHCENMEEQIQNRHYPLLENDIILIPPNISHSFAALEEKEIGFHPFSRYILWVEEDYLVKYLQDYPELMYLHKHGENCGGVIHTAQNIAVALQSKLNGIWNEQMNKRYGWTSAIDIGTLDILSRIGRMLYYTEDSAWASVEIRSLLDDICDYIVAHMQEKITLEKVGRNFHVSRSTISRIFRENLSLSFYEYVTQRRLTRATNLMLEGWPMNEICKACGFGDYSSFYRAFIKAYGISPREFCVQITEEKNGNTTPYIMN